MPILLCPYYNNSSLSPHVITIRFAFPNSFVSNVPYLRKAVTILLSIFSPAYSYESIFNKEAYRIKAHSQLRNEHLIELIQPVLTMYKPALWKFAARSWYSEKFHQTIAAIQQNLNIFTH